MTGASRSSRPSSTSCITSVAVHTLVIDPIWNSESGVASTPVRRLRTPYAVSATSPSGQDRRARRPGRRACPRAVPAAAASAGCRCSCGQRRGSTPGRPRRPHRSSAAASVRHDHCSGSSCPDDLLAALGVVPWGVFYIILFSLLAGSARRCRRNRHVADGRSRRPATTRATGNGGSARRSGPSRGTTGASRPLTVLAPGAE